jgi:hypothetical protein
MFISNHIMQFISNHTDTSFIGNHIEFISSHTDIVISNHIDSLSVTTLTHCYQ